MGQVHHGSRSKEPHSTVLSLEDEAVIMAFRRHTLLPLVGLIDSSSIQSIKCRGLITQELPGALRWQLIWVNVGYASASSSTSLGSVNWHNGMGINAKPN
jgi:hypothetical protein